MLIALDDTNYQSIPITDFPFFIGKLKKNVDYCLKEDVVSRYHAKLLKEGDRYFLMDMNSTNGTYINGEALKTYEKKEIKQGDEISFANIKYRLEMGAGQAANL
jgi:pSer/pThr/pTyr-binding forkhead associated (FHA) protein